MRTNETTTVTSSGVRVNSDSLAYIEALRASRPAVEMCAEHPAFELDNCPSCGTARTF